MELRTALMDARGCFHKTLVCGVLGRSDGARPRGARLVGGQCSRPPSAVAENLVKEREMHIWVSTPPRRKLRLWFR